MKLSVDHENVFAGKDDFGGADEMTPPVGQSRSSTEICRHWMNKGSCTPSSR